MVVNEFNSRNFGRCEILITFQWSGPDHWNAGLQNAYAELEAWTSLNKFQLQVPKCKELLIQFKKLRSPFPSVYTASGNLELVLHAKILGVTISDNLKWNKHRID
jgi:hypothetical protein